MQLEIPDSRQTYGAREALLYALSLGLGAEDPLDPEQLAFVFESHLRMLPTFGTVLAHPGFWARDLDSGLDWTRIVHAGHELVCHRPLPSAADVIGRSRIVDVIDRGPGKGALVRCERQILLRDTREPLCTNTQMLLCRGDGGIGGPAKLVPPPHPIPAEPADATFDWRIPMQAALLYRLNGDMNPLHADPAAARAAGFNRPILHGLAAYGMTGIALIKTMCAGDPALLARIAARFTSPVYPGETLRTHIWRHGKTLSFIVRVVGRDVVVINNGYAQLRDT
jgi:acyl dehydratase